MSVGIMIRTSKFLDFCSDWGAVLILIYFVLTAMLGTSYEHMNNQQYKVTALYVGPFLALFIGFIALYRFQFQDKVIQRMAVVFGAFFAWIALVLGTAGVVATINSNIGSQEEYCIRGTVTEKWQNSGFVGASYNLLIEQHKSGKPIALDASYGEYQKYSEGTKYNQCWTEGSLGLIYKK